MVSCFGTLQVVGSSVLIIYDSKHIGAWIIDFAKTVSLPEGVTVTHRDRWQQGNHEEGYLTGMDNLIKVVQLSLFFSFSSFLPDQSNRADHRSVSL